MTGPPHPHQPEPAECDSSLPPLDTGSCTHLFVPQPIRPTLELHEVEDVRLLAPWSAADPNPIARFESLRGHANVGELEPIVHLSPPGFVRSVRWSNAYHQ